MPVGDWQFWAVTAAFVVAAAYVLREVAPVALLSKRARRRKRERKVTLTVRGKSVR
jgi:hypothetical protein